MKLIINKNQINENPEQFLRRAGYGFISDRRSGKDSFVRRLTRDFYPRLHMYVESHGEQISFNLHLDQKQTSYHGSHMHNAEYDGPVVGQEIERLKGLINPVATNNGGADISQGDIFDKVGDGKLNRESLINDDKPKKKGFLKRLFG